MKTKSIDAPTYKVSKPSAAEDDAVVAAALNILQLRLRQSGAIFSSPNDVRNFVALRYAALPHEEFGVLFLDAQHGLIEHVMLFRGTLSQTSVYPREVAIEALQRGAAAVILVHNHPSGSPEPSRADEFLTQTLKSALALLDIKVLDHIVVGSNKTVSFAERGLI